MHIAIGLPSRVASASGELMLEWATRAERGPFSSLVVTDRVVSQSLEPLTVLALAAGAAGGDARCRVRRAAHARRGDRRAEKRLSRNRL